MNAQDKHQAFKSLLQPVGTPGNQLLFMGIVLDVRSAAVFYGEGQGCAPSALTQPFVRFK